MERALRDAISAPRTESPRILQFLAVGVVLVACVATLTGTSNEPTHLALPASEMDEQTDVLSETE